VPPSTIAPTTATAGIRSEKSHIAWRAAAASAARAAIENAASNPDAAPGDGARSARNRSASAAASARIPPSIAHSSQSLCAWS